MLAHRATHQVAWPPRWSQAMTSPSALTVPSVSYTDPEIAGPLTQTEAEAAGADVEIARIRGASGRALTLGRPEGS